MNSRKFLRIFRVIQLLQNPDIGELIEWAGELVPIASYRDRSRGDLGADVLL